MKSENLIKAIIFDMDGVLVDSEDFWKQAEYEVFSSLGVDVNEKLVVKTKYMTTQEVTQFWFERQPWSCVSLEEAERMVVDRVIHHIESENCIIPGVINTIQHLKISGFKVGLATNSPSKIIASVKDKLNLEGILDVIVSAEYLEKGKPDPAIYRDAAKNLNLAPSNCIAIEDSPSGIRAAKDAGMLALGFSHGKRNNELYLADLIFDSFDELDFKIFEN